MLYRRRFALILVTSLLATSCIAPGVSTLPEPDFSVAHPIHARVLLLMPDDFERFGHTNGFQGRQTQVQLGRQAADLMGIVLRNSFDSAGFIAVRSEPEAIDMISSGDPEVQQYDLVALPKFSRVAFWEKGYEYGYQISVSLELYSPGSGKIDTVIGRGGSAVHIHSGSSPQESANLALTHAVHAVKDGLEMRQATLSRGRR